MVMVMVMVNASLREGWLPQTQDSEEGDCDNKTSSCAAVNNTCISSRIQRLNRKGDNMLHCRVPLLQLNELKISLKNCANESPLTGKFMGKMTVLEAVFPH